ncbi:unnamed protein product, partial [Nesidiocoris tenuis]
MVEFITQRFFPRFYYLKLNDPCTSLMAIFPPVFRDICNFSEFLRWPYDKLRSRNPNIRRTNLIRYRFIRAEGAKFLCENEEEASVERLVCSTTTSALVQRPHRGTRKARAGLEDGKETKRRFKVNPPHFPRRSGTFLYACGRRILSPAARDGIASLLSTLLPLVSDSVTGGVYHFRFRPSRPAYVRRNAAARRNCKGRMNQDADAIIGGWEAPLGGPAGNVKGRAARAGRAGAVMCFTTSLRVRGSAEESERVPPRSRSAPLFARTHVRLHGCSEPEFRLSIIGTGLTLSTSKIQETNDSGKDLKVPSVLRCHSTATRPANVRPSQRQLPPVEDCLLAK